MISTYNCRLVCFDLFLSCVCVCVCECSVFCVVGKKRGIGRRCGVEVRLHFIYRPLAVVSSAPRIFSFPLFSTKFDQRAVSERMCVVTDWLLHHHIYWRRRYLLYIHKTFLYHFFCFLFNTFVTNSPLLASVLLIYLWQRTLIQTRNTVFN